jgi:uncharacterized integral membrane protein
LKKKKEYMGNYNQLIVVLFITIGFLVTPLFFIAFDFYSGIRKAKERGEVITSDKQKRTATKIARYYNMLLALLVMDAMQVAGFWYLDNFEGWHMPLFPWLVFLGSFFVGMVELRSIRESATEKERREMKQVTALGIELAKHRTDPVAIAEEIVKYLNGTEKEDGNG